MTSADASVVWKSAPAERFTSDELGTEREQEARVRDGGEQAEEDAEGGIAAVGIGSERAGDEDDADEHDRNGSHDPGAGPLREQQPGRDRHEHDLDVPEHRGQAGADSGDRVVPQNQVGGEETRPQPTRAQA